jgi:hypothetical protein
MAKQTLFPLIDKALGGTLEDRLRTLRTDEALSYDDIARQLADHDIIVSGELVRSWCLELGIPKGEPDKAGAA